MASLNKVMIIGNVGGEPEMRFAPNGNPVISFRVATNRVYTTSDGEHKEETEWFTVVAWNRLAEQCNQFLTKGRHVYVEGRLSTRSWQTPDGQRQYRAQVVAQRVLFLDKRGAAPIPEEKAGDTGNVELEPEDIPF